MHVVIPYFIFRVFCTITAARTQKQKERKEKINEFKENCRCYTYNVTLADPDFIVCYMQSNFENHAKMDGWNLFFRLFNLFQFLKKTLKNIEIAGGMINLFRFRPLYF